MWSRIFNLLMASVLMSCSTLGLEEFETFRCTHDSDCAVFNESLSDDSNVSYRCNLSTGDCESVPRDRDGDGFAALSAGGIDCNDNDPTIYPGADEQCGNMIDENCDGLPDDLDCDLHNAQSNGGDDCDDTDPSTKPGAREECNGIDDDCNGLLDAPDEDDDGDGHAGDCAGPATTDCYDDCDDAEECEIARSTYLNAVEVCDGIDNDCIVNGILRTAGGQVQEPSEDADGDGHAAVEAGCLSECTLECSCCSVVCQDIDECPWCVIEDVVGLCGTSLCPEECIDNCPWCFPTDDCDDRNAQIYAGAVELCDGLDNNCDDYTDNVDGEESHGGACNPSEVASGGFHTCLRQRYGTVVCWGSNSQGQLSASSALTGDAVLVQGLPSITQVASGALFSCALINDGTVTCWGDGALVRAGVLDYFADFGTVPDLDRVAQISAGFEHACAVTRGGEVACWGRAARGDIVGASSGEMSVGPTWIPGIHDALQVDAGRQVSCAVTVRGLIACWGHEDSGSLGNVHTIPNIDDAIEVACGNRACCALTGGDESQRSLQCWGSNEFGQLGFDPASGSWSDAPLEIDFASSGGGIPNSIQAGFSDHFCALVTIDGGDVARCWGSNSNGQLGIGLSTELLWEPVNLGFAEGVSVGWWHTCVQRRGGVECFGNNLSDQLGRGLQAETVTNPGPVSVVAAPLQIGDRCFRLRSRGVRCLPRDEDAPSWVGDFQDIISMTASTVDNETVGLTPRCIIREEGDLMVVRCFLAIDEEDVGILGVESDTVDTVFGLSDASHVTCGEAHCCALRNSGSVSCWGSNDTGQLGQGDISVDLCASSSCSRVPRLVDLPSEAIRVEAGKNHTCALLVEGQVICWGDNIDGQVGSPMRRSIRSPFLVADLPSDDPVVDISTALLGDTTCALLQGGTVRCWGSALIGGINSGPDPRTVAGIDTGVQLAMTTDSLCVRLASGATRCPDNNDFDPSRIHDAVDIGCGQGHCCLTRSSGQSLCWGDVPAGLVDSGALTIASPLPVVELLGE